MANVKGRRQKMKEGLLKLQIASGGWLVASSKWGLAVASTPLATC
jgi:hypothetical protein